MHLALADFWKTLLNSYIKVDGEGKGVSAYTPEAEVPLLVAGLVPSLLLRMEVLAHIFLVF